MFIKHRQANIRIRLGANITIYSDFQEFKKKYPNIIVLAKWHKYEYKYCPRAILFEYLNIHARHCVDVLTGIRWVKEQKRNLNQNFYLGGVCMIKLLQTFS